MSSIEDETRERRADSWLSDRLQSPATLLETPLARVAPPPLHTYSPKQQLYNYTDFRLSVDEKGR